MKKLIVIALVLLLAAPCFGAVGIQKDGVHAGTATDINISRGSSSFDGSTVTIFGSGMRGGVTANTSNASNLTSAALDYGVITKTGLAYTNDYKVNLAAGVPGQVITIILTAVASGSYVITDDGVAASLSATKTGWDDITMNAALDSVTLLYVDDVTGWIVIGTNSVTVT